MKTVNVVLKAHVVSDVSGAMSLRLLTGYGEPVVFVSKRRAPLVVRAKSLSWGPKAWHTVRK